MSQQSPNLRRRIFRFLRRGVSSSPILYSSLRGFFGRSEGAFLPGMTELVIEGFPRCGNSFVEASFLTANENLKLAHHTHAAAQVLMAIKHRTPVVVLIRDPAEAVASLIAHEPLKYDISGALKDYRHFYESLVHVADKVVVCDFSVIRSDVSLLLVRVSELYGVNLRRYLDSASSHSAEIFDVVNSISKSRGTIVGDAEPYSPTNDSDLQDIRRDALRKSAECIRVAMSLDDALDCRKIYERFLRMPSALSVGADK